MSFKMAIRLDGRKIQRMETIRGKMRGGQRTADRMQGVYFRQTLLMPLDDADLDDRIETIALEAEREGTIYSGFNVFRENRLVLSHHARRIC